MTDTQAAPPSAAVEPKVIKRYTNRKLYDTVESRYVTLEEIAEMVKGGAEVRIVDNRTKEDLTSVTLAQIIFEEEKKTSKMPLDMLRDIIRTGGNSVQTFFQKEITSRVLDIREGAEQLRDRLFKREGEDGGEAPPTSGASTEPVAPAAEAPKSDKGGKDLAEAKEGKEPKEGRAKLSPKELMALSQKTVESWQRVVDERIKAVVESMTSLPALAKDLAALEKQLAELEAKIKDLEQK